MFSPPRASHRPGKIVRTSIAALPAVLLALATATADPVPDHPSEEPRMPQEQKIPEPTAAAVLALLGGIVLMRRWKAR